MILLLLLNLFFFYTFEQKKKSNWLQRSWWRAAAEQRRHIWAESDSQADGPRRLAADGRWDSSSWRLCWALLQGDDVFVLKHLDQTATGWCLWWCLALVIQTLSSVFTSWMQWRLSLCPLVCPMSCLLENLVEVAVRLNVLCTDVHVERTLNGLPMKTWTCSTCCWCSLPW